MDTMMFLRKFMVNVYTAFIFDKDKRKRLRNELKKKHLTPDLRKMKLAVSYSVWDCEELLAASIRNIRPVADYISVVWQKYSWDDKECSGTLLPLLEKLKGEGLVDKIIYYDHKGKARYRAAKERQKRNVGLEDAKEAGCNYFLVMDADEFYDLDEFREASQLIMAHGVTHSACPILTYWKKPVYRDLDPAGFSVPFIYRIDQKSTLARNHAYPCLIDGSREMKLRKDSKFLYINRVNMHHMSFIRKDMAEKYKNASTGDSKLVDAVIMKYNGLNEDTLTQYNMVKVENRFNIDISG